MIDCIAGYHLNPWTCGIAKFNGILARHLGVSVFRFGSADQLAEEAACRAAGIEHLRFPLAGDGTGAVEHYAGAIAAIAKAHAMGQKVLVHCSSGSRRAGGVIAAYFLWVEREGERKSAAEARAEIERVDGDDATSERLITFLDENAAAIGARLTELGVTIRAPTPKLGH